MYTKQMKSAYIRRDIHSVGAALVCLNLLDFVRSFSSPPHLSETNVSPSHTACLICKNSDIRSSLLATTIHNTIVTT